MRKNLRVFISSMAVSCGLLAAGLSSAEAVEAFRLEQNGPKCRVVYPAKGDQPITRWDAKQQTRRAVAIGTYQDCTQPIHFGADVVKPWVFPFYKIDGYIFTAYDGKGNKVVFYREKGDNYRFRWYSPPK